MKICLYPYTEGSGIGTYIIELANALKQYTKETIIVIGEAEQLAKKKELIFYRTPQTPFTPLGRIKQLPPFSYIDPLFFGKEITLIVNHIKPDVFHTADHLPSHAITAPVIGVGWDFPKSPWACLSLAKKYSTSTQLPYRFVREIEMSVKDYVAMHKVKLILGITHYVTDALLAGGYHALYFPPGIMLPLQKTIKKNQTLTLTFVGRHHIGIKRKGLRYLLDALLLVKKKNPHDSFIIQLIGEIPPRFSDTLKQYSLLKEHIHLLGLLSREKTMEMIAQSHLLVAPSLYDEFGYAVLEAEAWGTPALVSAHNQAFHELVTNKEIVIDIFNKDIFAKQLEKLMKDKEKLIILGKEAQQHVALHYSWEKKGPELLRLYERVAV